MLVKTMPKRPSPTFYPPRENLAIYHLGWLLMRGFTFFVGTSGFELPREDAARLRACATHAALLCPNHPTPAEGPLMFLVGHKLALRYLHLTALEVYSKFGLLGPLLLPGAGCFSIRRRIADHPAYQAARQALGIRRNVVLFPEGEISGMSDALLPLERGAVQIAFWGLEALCEADPCEPLLIVPIAIKYREIGDAPRAVCASLSRLEHALDLPPASRERGGLWRLRRIEAAYLAALEVSFGCADSEPLTGNARWDRLRGAVARRASFGLDVPPPHPTWNPPQAARALLNAWEAAWLAHGPKGPPARSGEWTRLKTLHKDVVWLNRFMGLDERYVADWPSVERFGDVLRRIEEQVLGRHRFRRRVARLRVGEPINLAPLLSGYRAQRKATIAAVTQVLEERIRALLGDLVRELTVPWEGAYDTGDAGLRRVPDRPLRGSALPCADRHGV